MKRYLIDALVMIGIIGMFTLSAQGAGPKTAPLEKGADPTATLLLDQGIQQMKEGKPEVARASFALASQLDPNLSIPAFNTGAPGGVHSGGGFSEFGIASLLGFIFVLGMAAYEIGTTAPDMPAHRAESGRSPGRGLFEGERWPVAA